jgi:hypothetical protein
VATLELGLSIVFDVSALLLGISGSRIIAVRSGRCEITGALAVQGTALLVKRAHLELPGVVSLRRGIRLLPIAEYPAVDYPPDDHLGPGHQVIEDPADTDKPWWWSAGSPAGSPGLVT